VPSLVAKDLWAFHGVSANPRAWLVPIGQLAEHSRKPLVLRKKSGSPLGGRFFQLLPMVRRVPEYRQHAIVSQPTQRRTLKTRIALSIA
jgi:hypothetical protein